MVYIQRPGGIHCANCAGLVAFHLAAIVALVLLIDTHTLGKQLVLAVTWYVASGLGITAGYHRLFAHRSYEAHGVLRAIFLVWGAGAFQNSALKWVCDHRMHHAGTDRMDDPYDSTRGLWWSHIGWILIGERETTDS